MGNGLIAFLVAISATVWVYTKISRKTGGNATNSMVVAGVAGIFSFILVLIILGFIPA
jgi:hypothetical protein